MLILDQKTEFEFGPGGLAPGSLDHEGDLTVISRVDDWLNGKK